MHKFDTLQIIFNLKKRDTYINRYFNLLIDKNIKYNILIISDQSIKFGKKYIRIKATGEIMAGAGTGTSGSTVTAGIKEKNYLGKGITLDSVLSLSDDQIKGKFSVVNPNFRNTDRSINTTIESTSSDYMTSSGYKTTRTGLMIGTGFEQYEDLFFNFDLSTYYEKLETSDSASSIKKKAGR